MALEVDYAYSAYGETAVLGPDGGNALRYTGREDDGNGLFYYRARYYDPVLKRFVSEDPIGLEAGPNLYAYVGGNPVGFNDPTGEFMIISGNLRGQSMEQAVQVGLISTTALQSGMISVGAAASTATAGGGYFGVPSSVRYSIAIGRALIKGGLDDPALPPPQIPVQTTISRPASGFCPAPAPPRSPPVVR